MAFSNVADTWLQTKKGSVRHKTHKDYTGHVENHLAKHFGLTLVSKINLEAVERFIADPECCESGHSVSLTRKILRTFSDVMTYASRRKYIDHNPVKDAEKPKKEIEQEEVEEPAQPPA